MIHHRQLLSMLKNLRSQRQDWKKTKTVNKNQVIACPSFVGRLARSIGITSKVVSADQRSTGTTLIQFNSFQL
jgi:hypothetical protein